MAHRSRPIGPRLSYANVVSTLALFLVVSGGVALAVSIPANSVGSKKLKNNSARSIDLKDGAAVRGADVVDDSLTGADISESTLSLPVAPPGANSIGSTEVVDDTLTTADFAGADPVDVPLNLNLSAHTCTDIVLELPGATAEDLVLASLPAPAAQNVIATGRGFGVPTPGKATVRLCNVGAFNLVVTTTMRVATIR